MPHRTSIDCEFNPFDPSLTGLLALGVTDDANRSYYAINADVDLRPLLDNAFLVEHVLPQLPVTVRRGATDVSATGVRGPLRRWWRRLRAGRASSIEWDTSHPHFQYVRPARQIADDLEQFFHAPTELIAKYGAQDICRLHSLWGNDWATMPQAVPRYFTDI
ncbi:hypothetical protein AB0O20_34325 [Streptomyces kronopolitis]|uniref:hypothetical protein n=1 Tax=Streptomyces kronopolitis TaxID=1612435 RepID=UPI0034135B3E